MAIGAQPVRLVTALEEAQLRALEPRVYHLVLCAPPRASTAGALERAVEDDSAPDPYAVLVEPLPGLLPLGVSLWRLPRACHVSLVTRSAFLGGLARAADRWSRLAGGPPIEWFASLEPALARARRALVRSALWRAPG